MVSRGRKRVFSKGVASGGVALLQGMTHTLKYVGRAKLNLVVTNKIKDDMKWKGVGRVGFGGVGEGAGVSIIQIYHIQFSSN